jgi:periplasmic divalent cation tolerance protein
MLIVYTVMENEERAKRLGRMLLEANLCACVNIIPGIKSMYHWEGKIEEADECILLIKTLHVTYMQIEEMIKREHGYDVPAIFTLEPEHIETDYENWLKNQLK